MVLTFYSKESCASEATIASKEARIRARPDVHFGWSRDSRIRMQGDHNVGDAFWDFPGMPSDPHIRFIRHAIRKYGGEKSKFPVLVRFGGDIPKLNFVISPPCYVLYSNFEVCQLVSIFALN